MFDIDTFLNEKETSNINNSNDCIFTQCLRKWIYSYQKLFIKKKNTPNSPVNEGDLKKIKSLLKDYKPSDRNDPRLNKKNGL